MTEFKRKSAKDATPEEVRQYARFNGLEIDAGAQKQTVLDKMKLAGFNVEEITVFETQKPQASDGGSGTFKNADGKDCYMIFIPEEDKPGGQEPVPVGVNGSVMLIPRGKDVPVPVEFVLALRNAVMDIYDPVTEGYGGIRKPRHVPAYPFQIVPKVA